MNPEIRPMQLALGPLLYYWPRDTVFAFYERIGFNERQIEIVASALPKREYYVASPDGRRLFDMALGPVALAFAGANLDNRALPGVYVAVVMGRHAGFLTAASALGRKFDDDGPHLIYVPERVFNLETFVRDVQEVYNKHGRCIVAVSEGIHDDTGEPIATKLAEKVERDAHGNVQLSGSGALADLLTDYIKANTNITRAQACVIVNRALGRSPDEDRLLDEDEMITWPDNNPEDWFYADMQEATNSHDYPWVTVSGDKVEKWTEKLEQRDWAALEHAWSTAHSAPGGEVTK